MRHLALIILIVLMPVFPSCKYFKTNRLFGRKAASESVLMARQDSIRIADSIRMVNEQQIALEDEKLAAARKADSVKTATENKYTYNIIIGSFENPEYAKEYADTYRKQGYDTRIIRLEGTKFQLVSAGAFDRLGDAASKLKEIQDSKEIMAWMYVKK